MLSEFLQRELTQFNPKVELPLHRRLYEAMRKAMLDGRLTASTKLPSSRSLAEDLGISRNTIIAAINQLSVEGYVIAQQGSGTYVSDHLPKPSRLTHFSAATANRNLSSRGLALSTRYTAQDLEILPFTPGIPDFSAFPTGIWQRLQNKHWRMTYPDMLDYAHDGGHPPLRRALTNYLRVSRSLSLDTDQLIITSGTQQSLDLCTLLLADYADTVWIEDPAYWGAVKSFMAGGLKLHPIPVDEFGLNPDAATPNPAPKLIYLTPSHQYPTGAVMSLARRQRILHYASLHQAFVLEDDYDSEFRFDGHPLSSLEGLDLEQQVFYMGTFSKALYPGIKLGYLVVPKRMVAAFKQAHYDIHRPGQMPLQAALAEFIESGHYANTLRKTRLHYATRRLALLAALQPCIQAGAVLSGAGQGLHLCLMLPAHIDDKLLSQALLRQHIFTRPLSAYSVQPRSISGLVIGYGYANLLSIEKYSPILASVILSHLQ